MKVILALSAAAVATAQVPVYNRGIYGHRAHIGHHAPVRFAQPAAVTIADDADSEVVAPRVFAPRARGIYGFAPKVAAPVATGLFGGAKLHTAAPPAGASKAQLDHWLDMQVAEHVVTETEADYLNELNYQLTDSESSYADTAITLSKVALDAAAAAAKLNHEMEGTESSALDMKEAELEKAIGDIEFFNINSKISNKEQDLLDNLGWMVDDIDRQSAALDLKEAEGAEDIADAEVALLKETMYSYAGMIELTDKNGKYTKSENKIFDLAEDFGELDDLDDVVSDTEGRAEAEEELAAAKIAAASKPNDREAQIQLELAKHELTLATVDFIDSLSAFVTVSDNDDFWDMQAMSEVIAEYEIAKLTKELVALGYHASFSMNDDGIMMP